MDYPPSPDPAASASASSVPAPVSIPAAHRGSTLPRRLEPLTPVSQSSADSPPLLSPQSLGAADDHSAASPGAAPAPETDSAPVTPGPAPSAPEPEQEPVPAASAAASLSVPIGTPAEVFIPLNSPSVAPPDAVNPYSSTIPNLPLSPSPASEAPVRSHARMASKPEFSTIPDSSDRSARSAHFTRGTSVPTHQKSISYGSGEFPSSALLIDGDAAAQPGPNVPMSPTRRRAAVNSGSLQAPTASPAGSKRSGPSAKWGRTPTFMRATSKVTQAPANYYADSDTDNGESREKENGAQQSADELNHSGPSSSSPAVKPAEIKRAFSYARFSFSDKKAKNAASQHGSRRPAHSRQTLERMDLYKEEDVNYGWQDMVAYYLDGPIVTLIITAVVLIALALSIGSMMGMQDQDSLDLFCSIFFAIECAVRLLVYGYKRYFSSVLCWLDLIATILDWISFALLSKGFGGFIFFRVLRFARITKVSKISRLSNYAHEAEENVHFVQKDSQGRIYAYNPDRLFSLGFLMHLSGTVLVQPEIWIQFIFLLILTSLWAANLCPIECNDESSSYDPHASCSGCVVAFSLESSLMFSALVAFLLGIFSSITFERWWSIRKFMSQLTEEKNHCAHLSMAFCPFSDRETLDFRNRLVRYLNLSMALTYKQADDDDNFTDLVRSNYLTEAEWDLLEHENDKYSIVYTWLSALVNEFAKKHRFISPNTAVSLLHSSFSLQRTLSNQIMMHIEVQVPFVFVNLMTLIVKAHLLLVCGGAATFVGHGIMHQQVINALWGYLIVFFSNLILEGLLRIHCSLYNPFGVDHCDLPEELLLGALWNSTHTIISRGHKQRLPFETTDTPLQINSIGNPPAQGKDAAQQGGAGGPGHASRNSVFVSGAFHSGHGQGHAQAMSSSVPHVNKNQLQAMSLPNSTATDHDSTGMDSSEADQHPQVPELISPIGAAASDDGVPFAVLRGALKSRRPA